jgi:PIN domain nuclease of toxin-antitoxin system
VLLDTCAFIWLTIAPELLGAKAAKALDDPSNDRVLSLASVWEITLKQ